MNYEFTVLYKIVTSANVLDVMQRLLWFIRKL